MSTSSDFDRYPHGCEIVIPIILKIPIYIEPIVIEKNEVCHRQYQPEKVSFEPKWIATDPAALADQEKTAAVVNQEQSTAGSDVKVASGSSLLDHGKGWLNLLLGSGLIFSLLLGSTLFLASLSETQLR